MCAGHLEKISLFAWSAIEDAYECVAHMNSDCIRKLRGLWMDQADLLPELVEQAKTLPIPRGFVPAKKSQEYSALIFGDKFKKTYEAAYHRAKASDTLSKRQKAMHQFRTLTVQRSGSSSGGHQQAV